MHYDMLMDEDHERIEDLFSKVFQNAFIGHKSYLQKAKSKLEDETFFVMQLVESQINHVQKLKLQEIANGITKEDQIQESQSDGELSPVLVRNEEPEEQEYN